VIVDEMDPDDGFAGTTTKINLFSVWRRSSRVSIDYGHAASVGGCHHGHRPTSQRISSDQQSDSRTILGEQGAEQLLGMGDMLCMAGGSKIMRVHGPFCSDESRGVTYLKAYGPPENTLSSWSKGQRMIIPTASTRSLVTGNYTDGEDALYDTTGRNRCQRSQNV
jgi:hypothetical protein